MTFDEYQEAAAKTAVYPNIGKNLTYAALGLGGEAGEVLNKVKKIQRDAGGVITPIRTCEIMKELGDVLWYAAAMCSEMAVSLEDVAVANLSNLSNRKERGTLHGSGDNR